MTQSRKAYTWDSAAASPIGPTQSPCIVCSPTACKALCTLHQRLYGSTHLRAPASQVAWYVMGNYGSEIDLESAAKKLVSAVIDQVGDRCLFF